MSKALRNTLDSFVEKIFKSLSNDLYLETFSYLILELISQVESLALRELKIMQIMQISWFN